MLNNFFIIMIFDYVTGGLVVVVLLLLGGRPLGGQAGEKLRGDLLHKYGRVLRGELSYQRAQRASPEQL